MSANPYMVPGARVRVVRPSLMSPMLQLGAEHEVMTVHGGGRWLTLKEDREASEWLADRFKPVVRVKMRQCVTNGSWCALAPCKQCYWPTVRE